MYQQEFKQIPAGNGHQQALGQLSSDLFLEVIGLVLKIDDLLFAHLNLVPVLTYDVLEESDELSRTLIASLHMVLDGPHRGGAENLADIASQ